MGAVSNSARRKARKEYRQSIFGEAFDSRAVDGEPCEFCARLEQAARDHDNSRP
jgi:hypothetical protein